MNTTNKMRAQTAVLAAALFLISPTLAQAFECDPTTVTPQRTTDNARGTPAAFDWGGEYQQIQVCYPSRRSNAELAGYLLAPINLDSFRGPLPVVVIGPGSGGTVGGYNYLWSARELASHGYLVLAGDPQGVRSSEVLGDPDRCGADGCPGVPFQETFNFVDGLLSATDFVFSGGHPWLLKADLTRVGMAGHSLSARAASYVPGVDDRIKAVVAWDNLTSDLYGDAGISSGGGTCGSVIGGELPNSLPVNIRVPSMGQASDATGGCTPTNTDVDIKKTAYQAWRAAGVASMQLVFKGAAHGDFAQSSSGDPAILRLSQYYTRCWFDLYLKNDESARACLISPQVLEQPVDQLLSSQFRSAMFLPESKIDCADLATELPANGCNPTLPVTDPIPLPPVPVVTSRERFGGALLLEQLGGFMCLFLMRRRARSKTSG